MKKKNIDSIIRQSSSQRTVRHSTFLFKYIIDGDWTADPATPINQLLRDGKGHAGLTEVVVR